MYGAAQEAASLEAAAEQVIRWAQAGGDTRAAIRGSASYAHAAVYGPTPVKRGIARLNDLVESATVDQHAVASMNLLLSQLLAMDRDFEAARSLYRANAAKLAELQTGVTASSTSTDTARVEMLAGDLEAAEALLRRDLDALKAIDERYLLATVTGMLARALVAQAKDEEAAKFVGEAENLLTADDVDGQAIVRGAKARLMARAGKAKEAVSLAQEAVALRESSDYVVDHAEALLDLSVVMSTVGKHEDAKVAAGKARALARKKGNRAMLDLLDATSAGQRAT
jgi:ATP/maltotriose-dependent transcriptional regulator MalT